MEWATLMPLLHGRWKARALALAGQTAEALTLRGAIAATPTPHEPERIQQELVRLDVALETGDVSALAARVAALCTIELGKVECDRLAAQHGFDVRLRAGALDEGHARVLAEWFRY